VSAEEERLRSLDEQPEDQWLVPPWYEIQEEDQLSVRERRLLHEIIRRRSPELLPQLDFIGIRVQRPSERERVRSSLIDEFTEFGIQKNGEPNEYGRDVDNLIGRLGRI
jgi:hypothetical protein